MIPSYTAIGNTEAGAGLSNAFLMHVEALKTVADVQVFDFNQSGKVQGKSLYIHGLPAQIEQMFQQNPSLLECQNNILYLTCESDTVGHKVQQISAHFDQLWCPSTFCQSVFQKSLSIPVKIIPHYVNDWSFRKKIKKPSLTYLSIFNSSSRILRKNPFLIIRGFKEAFGKSTEHKLILKVTNCEQFLLKELTLCSEGYDIAIITDFLDWQSQKSLYHLADWIISLHSGEGFGLVPLEALACGTPSIATAWSGTEDFLIADVNSLKVDYKLIAAEDDFFFGNWAEPSLNSFKETLIKSTDVDLLEFGENAFKTSLLHSFSDTVRLTKNAICNS